MTVHSLSDLWSAAASILGDHLWQSTLCAVVAALLTLALCRNQARVRYWLWLAASIKFLVPFSVLVTLGNYFAWRHISNAGGALYVAIEQVGQPFTQVAPAMVQAAPPSYSGPHASSNPDRRWCLAVRIPDRVWHMGCALAANSRRDSESGSSAGGS